MKISNRLKLIASMVDKNKNIIDVGCDHALLDIYLTIYNNNKCIASDINNSSIEKAKENILKYELKDKIDVFLTNGLENIKIKKDTTVIICGMGANNIINILTSSNLTNITNLIIQSNNDLSLLRKEVSKLGFYIADENIIYDKKIYYVIIKFKRGIKNYQKKDYILGPILKNKKSNVVFDYYNYIILNNQKIINNLPFKYIIKKNKLKKLNKIYKKCL